MYRQKDIDIIEYNLDKIGNTAKKIYIDNYYEPTIQEYEAVMNEIKKYIEKNNLIIYGGYAQNELIKKKNSKDVFYNKYDRNDIEIYSPDPINDGMKISEDLFKKGFKYIEFKEGIHNETYKIFSNFINYCDITYMDPHVFKNCPYIKVGNLKMTHPHFMLTDAYRVYADMMTSNFRLEKTFKRFSKLIKHYPFDIKNEKNKLSYKRNDSNEKILRFIRKHIIHNSNLIVIGHYAYNYLVKKVSNDLAINFEYIQVISSDFKSDFDKITKILKKQYGKDIFYKKFNPFFQFYDERVEYCYKGKVVLKLYGNNEKCIVFQKSDKKKTLFGTFVLVMLHLIADYNHSIINKNKVEEANYISLIVRLIKIRNEYFKSRELNVMDDTIFKEFSFKCIGTPVDPIRDSLLKGLKNKKAGKRVKFSYRPTGTLGKVPQFKFNNSSGLEVKRNKK